MGDQKTRRHEAGRASVGGAINLIIFAAILLAGLWLFTQTSFGRDLFNDLVRLAMDALSDFVGFFTSWATR